MWKKLRERAHVFWLKHRGKIVMSAVGFGTGVVISGAVTALKDHKRIDELEEDCNTLFDTTQHLIDTGYNTNEAIRADHSVLVDLVRQNNLLFEKALRETEGTAE